MIPKNLVHLTILGQTYLNLNGELVSEVEKTGPPTEPIQVSSHPLEGTDPRAERHTASEVAPRPLHDSLTPVRPSESSERFLIHKEEHAL